MSNPEPIYTQEQMAAVISECADIALRLGHGGMIYSMIKGINWNEFLNQRQERPAPMVWR